MNDDATLLRRYAADGSQDAFAELVRRHLGLVYHAALRQCGGDPHRAEDVAQLVFTDLARQADTLSRHPLLVAWLHTATRHAAAHLRRTEARRRAREQVAFAMSETDRAAPDPVADWERLRPLIDDALQSLGERDRAAVLLRFFENRPYAELAAALSVTEDAARVRVNRALEKLRAALARRGLVSTSAALALALVQPALAATPPGLDASVTTASLSSAATAVGTGTLVATAAVMSTAKIAATTAGALALLSLGVSLYQHPPAALRTPASPPPPSLSAAELAILLHPARLSPADAAAALAAYLALPPLAEDATPSEFAERAARLRALLTVLPAEQHAQLLAATTARGSVPEDRLRRIAFSSWTDLDAPAAARWIAALETTPGINGNQRADLACQATLAWALTDFDAAYTWATALRPGLARLLGGQLLARLVRTDSVRALALARAGDVAYFDGVRRWIFSAWLDHDPAAAFRTLGAEMFASPEDRHNLPGHLAQWAWRDPQAALAWFDTEAPGEALERTNQLGYFISSFASKSPPPDFATLGSALLTRAESGFGRDRLEYFLRTWMNSDTTAALRWLDALPDASLRDHILRQSLQNAGYEDPEKLFPLARRLPADAARARSIDQILNTWSQKSPDAALAWLDTPEGAELAGPDAAQIVRIGAVARQDPAAALANWDAIASADTRRDTAPALAQAWAVQEPDAAAAWLFAQIPEGPNQSDPDTISGLGLDAEQYNAYWKLMQPYWRHAGAYDRISADWLARDPAGFVAWAESLPGAVRQRSALFSLTWAAATRANADRPDPASRIALIATLQDPTLRDPLLGGYLREWQNHDEVSARRWASEHGAEALLPAASDTIR